MKLSTEKFEIITKEDLNNLNISNSVQTMILEGVTTEQSSIESLRQIVSNLKNLIEKVMKTSTSSKKRSYTYSYAELRKNTFRQITLVGALVVFRLREFLLQEQIIFSLGVTDSYGQLYERQISQDELFDKVVPGGKRLKVRSSLSEHAILLSKSLETFKVNENYQQVGELNLWPSILKLAFDGPRIAKSGDDKKEGDTDYYQKDSADKNVYVRYSEGKKQILSYYYLKNGYFQYYNQGWLYEWYMEYLSSSAEAEKILQGFINKQSIEPIISKMDKLEVYKGGDYVSLKNQQMQAKYSNQQMISYVSILKVLKEIDDILSKWNENCSIKDMSEEFVKLFTNDTDAVDKLNNNYSKIIQDQLFSIIDKKMN